MEAPMASSQLRIVLALSLTLLLGFAARPARAEDGVSDHKILFGQVAALSGPAKDLGDTRSCACSAGVRWVPFISRTTHNWSVTWR